MKHPPVGICGVLMMLTMPATAWAALDWSAPADCPTRDIVNARINALAGAPAQALPFSASAQVSHDPSAAQPWRVRIETILAAVKGERTFNGASCEAVTNATVVFITLMLTEHAQPPVLAPARPIRVPAPARPIPVPAPAQPFPAPAPAPPIPVSPAAPAKVAEPEAASVAAVKLEPEPRQATAREDAVAPVEAVPNKPMWHGRMHLGVAHGEIAKTALQVGLTAGVSWQRLPALAIELDVGSTLPRSTQPFANQPWISVTQLALDAHLGPCLQTPSGRLLMRACSTLGLQFVRLTSKGVSQPESGSAFIPTTGVKLLLGWRLAANWALIANSSVDVRLAQPSFAVQPWGNAWSAPRLTFSTGFAFEWRR